MIETAEAGVGNNQRAQLIKEIYEDTFKMRLKMAERHSSEPDNCAAPGSQGLVLSIVGRRADLSIKEIAEIMRVSGSAVTQLVDALVKAGLLERRADEHDRRLLRISLTKTGQTELEKIRAVRLASMGRLLEPLSKVELETYRNLQRKIVGD